MADSILDERWAVGRSVGGAWNVYVEESGIDVTPGLLDGPSMDRDVCDHIVRLHNATLGTISAERVTAFTADVNGNRYAITVDLES